MDNGLDLIVHKHGLTTLVQCRHWHNRNVTVKDVREMHSLMKYHHASAVKIIACGDYTDDAWKLPFRAPASPPPMHHRPRTVAHT